MTLTVTGIAEENGVKNVSFSADNPKADFWLENGDSKRGARIQQNSAPVGCYVYAHANDDWFYALFADDVAVGDNVTMTEIGGGSPG